MLQLALSPLQEQVFSIWFDLFYQRAHGEWWFRIKEQNWLEETHWEKAAKTKMGKYLTETETEFIFQAITLSKCNSIMDVGAEAGRFSLLGNMNELEMMGIDIDSYGLKRLKQNNRGVNIILADARKIPLREKVLDAAFMIEVLDYIAELEITLSECCTALKHGGSLILSFGNNSSLKSILRRSRGRTYQHSYGNVLHSLDKAGFKVKRKLGYNWLPFNRVSDNPLIPLLARIEKILGLRRLCRFSPWVLVYAVKSE
jgi:SAM-dependent methyltransferase